MRVILSKVRLNLNYELESSHDLLMNLNLVFSKSMNLNLKIKKKMSASNPDCE